MLISCILPTANRRRFATQAIHYFARQTYQNRELIIIDDGQDSIEDLAKDQDRVRYIRLAGRLPLGAKRNLACELARGELVANWDDDDWIGCDRLTEQSKVLNDTGAQVCGARDLSYYAPLAGQAWRYTRQSSDPLSLCGGTLLYRKSLWQEHRYPELDFGEDETFVRGLPSASLQIMSADPFYVGILHGANTAPKSLRPPRWKRAPLDPLVQRLREDRGFYAGLRNRGAPQRTTPISGGLTLVAPFLVYDGYGSMAEYLALGLAGLGVDVRPVPLTLDQAGLTPEMRAMLSQARPRASDPVLYFSFPQSALAAYGARSDLFISTMWEGDRLPPGWTQQINRARAVIVPSRFVAEVCRNSGVTRPVEVVPQGIDPQVYALVDRPQRDTLTTLIVGTVIGRKHVREGIEAWRRAFGADPDARLVIKSQFHYGNYVPDDPRIRFDETNIAQRGIASLYAEADVLLALGNEGFGLPLVEGMASGLPVIALNTEGQADICDDARGLVLPVPPGGREPCEDTPFGPGGQRAVPDVAATARQLRWVAENRMEANAMGTAAAEWARANRDIWTYGPMVADVLDRHSSTGRPVAPRALLWVPSAGRRCGVAEYGAQLSACLRRTTLQSSVADLRGFRHLHLEHEFGIVPNQEAARVLRMARISGILASITLHTVFPHEAEFERDATALVALTRRGFRTLQATRPGRICAHIPHGCPTWFPPQKRQRGRVIGAFGFLGRHKGFFELLETVGQLGNVELILFSHAHDAALAAAFDRSAAGLPVRRIDAFLPAEQVARRLAEEADVLAFWYRDASNDYASGAVHVGLATGVPVLASRVACFDDLEGAVHRTDDLARGLGELLDDTVLRERVVAAARDYCNDNAWARTAARYRALWTQIRS